MNAKPLLPTVALVVPCRKECQPREPCGRSQQAARARQQTETCKELYKRRAGIEGTSGQATLALGRRRTRYRRRKKTPRHHIAIATAMTLQRCIAGWWEVPRARMYKGSRSNRAENVQVCILDSGVFDC